MNKNISRRDFIKAAAVSGLGVAAASVLGGCAKNQKASIPLEPIAQLLREWEKSL